MDMREAQGLHSAAQRLGIAACDHGGRDTGFLQQLQPQAVQDMETLECFAVV